MSTPLGSSQFFLNAAQEGGQSLRFEDGDSAYLTLTPTSAGNRRTWTFSTWIKRGNITSNQGIFGAESSGDRLVLGFGFSGSDQIRFYCQSPSTDIYTSAVLRDPSAWYNIVWAVDTTQATSTNRIKIYVNGEQITSFASASYPAQNSDYSVNNTVGHYIGRWAAYNGEYLDGYLANACFIDGQQLDPTSFGEYDDTLWKPKSDADITSLTFGTNGFYLPFAGDIAAGSSYYFDGSSDYVSYSSASLYDVGSSDDFELECFFNTDMVSGSGDYGYMLGNYDGSSQFMTLQPDFRSANESFAWYIGNGQAWVWDYTSGDVSPNTWHHLTISRTSGTLRMFLDGVRLTSITSASASNGSISGGNVISNTTSYNLSSFRIGESFAGQKAYKGYVSNVRFIVGSSIRNSDSNFTVPTATLTDVTNTKLLTATNLTIGDDISSNNNDGSGSGNARASGVNPFGEYDFFEDVSGNGNNWSPNNLQYTDVVLDSPVTGGNFATLNPIQSLYSNSVTTFSEGNLKAALGNSSNWRAAVATQQHSSGKWYYEVYANQGSNGFIGFGHDNFDINGAAAYAGSTAGSWGWLVSGELYNNAASIDTLSTYTTGDIISIALDFDNAKAYWAKNGTWENSADPAAGTGGTSIDADKLYKMGFSNVSGYASTANFGQDSSFAGNATPQGNTDSNGVGDFYYAPPSGFLALTTGNLPAATITAPDEHFNTVTYAGNNTQLSVTGVNFQPDLTWIKKRSSAAAHVLQDAVRGTFRYLIPNDTAAENTSSANDWFRSFDSDGFTVSKTSTGAVDTTEWNNSGTTFVAWNWLAGNGTSANSQGSIASTVSANQTAGFSIVTFTSPATSSTAFTVGHGLSFAPEMIITKERDGTLGWLVYHDELPSPKDNYLLLNSTAGNSGTVTDCWGTSAPTSSVFGMKTTVSINTSKSTIAYCFHSVEGYSKIGSYTGDSDADGPFVHCGFRPSWVLIKSIGSGTYWLIMDNTRDVDNVVTQKLSPTTNAAENDTATMGTNAQNLVDFLSNGFKLRATEANTNTSTQTYIFYAVAEAPFKLANAR